MHGIGVHARTAQTKGQVCQGVELCEAQALRVLTTVTGLLIVIVRCVRLSMRSHWQRFDWEGLEKKLRGRKEQLGLADKRLFSFVNKQDPVCGLDLRLSCTTLQHTARCS